MLELFESFAETSNVKCYFCQNDGQMEKRNNAILVLEDGTTFHGKAIGKIGKVGGELAFNTGMTGYQEIFTDPSNKGHLMLMTSPHIGNYGTTEVEACSDKIQCEGIIVKKFSHVTSRAKADLSLQDLLLRDEKVGIADIDTRSLVRHLRSKGAMTAIISSEENVDEAALKKEVKDVPSIQGQDLSRQVSIKEAQTYLPKSGKGKFKVALIDFGAMRAIHTYLNELDCEVRKFPMDTSIQEINAFQPDGFMLSNGPGDPAAMTSSHQLVKEIVATNIPVMGICLGHQLLALSQGITVEKMHHGHRGANHPVKNHKTGRCEVTSQDHGFVVSRSKAEENKDIEITYSHLNDNSIAGIALKGKPVFSVQFHPEPSAGPNDSMYLFDEFISHMKDFKQ